MGKIEEYRDLVHQLFDGDKGVTTDDLRIKGLPPWATQMRRTKVDTGGAGQMGERDTGEAKPRKV